MVAYIFGDYDDGCNHGWFEASQKTSYSNFSVCLEYFVNTCEPEHFLSESKILIVDRPKRLRMRTVEFRSA